MSVKQSYTIELNDRQYAYLKRMAEKHELPDVGKAVRVLVDHAMHEPAEEEKLFTTIRCSGC